MANAGPFRPEALSRFLTTLFMAAGASAGEAAVVADAIVDAELRENRSQGLQRVANYVDAGLRGKVASPTKVRIQRELPGVLVLDSGHGWPHVACLQAMELCVERAARNGSCVATVKNTGHIGRLGYFVEAAARKGMVGFIMAGGGKGANWVAPWGGTKGIWGTNPMAIGFPRRSADPIVVDLSTTQTSRGNVLMAQRLGQPLPPGWALDNEGNPTTDPAKALPPHGTLAPLGGYKGYALALAVHILCGAVAGTYRSGGGANFLGAIDIAAFTDRDQYENEIEQMVADIKAVPRKAGVVEIYLPGEQGAARARRNRVEGIFVPDSLWNEVTELAHRLKVKDPLLNLDI